MPWFIAALVVVGLIAWDRHAKAAAASASAAAAALPSGVPGAQPAPVSTTSQKWRRTMTVWLQPGRTYYAAIPMSVMALDGTPLLSLPNGLIPVAAWVPGFVLQSPIPVDAPKDWAANWASQQWALILLWGSATANGSWGSSTVAWYVPSDLDAGPSTSSPAY